MSDSFTPQDLIRWSEALAGIARTGLGFTQSLYEQERFEEVLAVAADMRVAAGSTYDPDDLVHEWMKSVGVGVPGYQTPKVAVGAIVQNEADEILLVQRSDSGVCLYPTGWADIGYSPAEVAVKEVSEETGIDCEVLQLLAVYDGLQRRFTSVPLYSLVFHCRATGGSLQAHPLETSDVGWFSLDDLPLISGVHSLGTRSAGPQLMCISIIRAHRCGRAIISWWISPTRAERSSVLVA